MGWFSPVKGEYPGLSQVDKTLPVKSGITSLERGMIVALKSDDGSKEGVWDVAGSADTELLYVALQDLSDPTAGFAGDAFNPDGGMPRITALDLGQDGEFETSVFADEEFAVGDALYVANGKLTKTSGAKLVGYVTSPRTERWINNAIAVPAGGTDQRLAFRTGANKEVIRFKTAV